MSPQTKNPQLLLEYRARINRVMDFIEADLASDFTLEGLSRVAGFSKFHFNRIFHSLTGESLFAFIQRVRVEKAAVLLLNNRTQPITAIALDCGFSSSAAFSRSFKKHFGLSASKWRQSGKTLTDVKGDQSRLSGWSGAGLVEPESVEVKMFPPRTLAYVRHTGRYKGDAELFARLFQKLFHWAEPRELGQLGETECLVLYHDSIDITESDRLRISVCIDIPEDTPVSGEVGKLTLDEGRYVCVRFHLDDSEYADAWCWVFNQFFPSSGYQPEDGVSFELYPVQGAGTGKTLVDICVPVKPL